MAQHDLGQSAQARQTLDAFIATHADDGAYSIAQAFAWLSKAIHQHTAGLGGVNRDPLLSSLRSDHRFGDVLKQIGLSPVAVAPLTASSSRAARP